MLADCETGYILDMILYTGSAVDADKQDEHGLAGNVVKKMVDRYYGKNHVLYTDNFYTHPALSKFLLSKKLHTVGTVRQKRRGFPKFQGQLRKGDIERQQADNMLAFRWMHNKEVRMLSTIHKGEMQDSGKVDKKTQQRVDKPDAVLDYNVNMRLIDKKDMMVGSIECIRKCVKWYKKLFLHLIDVTVLNAYHLWSIKTGKRTSLRLFQKTVLCQLLEKHGQVQPLVHHKPRANMPDRLLARDYISRHHLIDIPASAQAAGKRNKGQRRCHVCANTTVRQQENKKVTQKCQECDLAFCLPCFKDYHCLTKY